MNNYPTDNRTKLKRGDTVKIVATGKVHVVESVKIMNAYQWVSLVNVLEDYAPGELIKINK